MKTTFQPIRTRSAWLLAAPALLITPAAAQDTAPPPVRATVPQAITPVTPSPAVTQPPTLTQPPRVRENGNRADSITDPQSKTVLSPEAQAALDDAQDLRAVRRPARAAAPTRQVARTTTRTTAQAAAQNAPTPVPVLAPTPAMPSPAPEALAPAPVPEAPADTVAPVAEGTARADDTGAPLWPLALIMLAILAVGGFFFMRGRRSAAAFDGQYEPEADYDQAPSPTPAPYIDPTPAFAAPATAAAAVAAAPLADRADEPTTATSEEANVVDAEAADVAALTAAAAPARNRPWLEFAMRPVRAGTSIDEALVEIELTVANSGSIAARDVRVSTFLLTDANAGDMDRMLATPSADAAAEPVMIEPGQGARIDATLAAAKADVGEAGDFTPIVIADARYRLPDGSEGRTSASFVVGIRRDGGTLTPIDLADRVMRDDIEARLHGEVQHA